MHAEATFRKPAGNTLVATLWPQSETRGVVRAVVLAFVGALILTVAAKIRVPFYPVPMTLQTLAVLMLGAAYGPRLAVASVALYLAQGALGLPVFTNTPPLAAGPSYFLGSTGGFLAGFLVSAWVVGHAAERGWDRAPLRLFAVMFFTTAVTMALGVAWLATFAQVGSATGLGLGKALAVGLYPFALGELVKVALAAASVSATWMVLAKLRGR